MVTSPLHKILVVSPSLSVKSAFCGNQPQMANICEVFVSIVVVVADVVGADVVLLIVEVTSSPVVVVTGH